MTETVKLYKDQSGTLWKGPLYCGEETFFATIDLAQQVPILVPGFVDPQWKAVEWGFGMSLDALNKFLPDKLDINASLVDRARAVAIHAHRGQTRWNGDEYITHPIRVAQRLRSRLHGGSENDDEQVVAYLHDVVEDTEITLEQLREFGFTEEQVEAVDSVTERKGESYLDFVLRAKANPIGNRVKMADIEDNSTDLFGDTFQDRREKYQMALWILRHQSYSTPPCAEGCHLE